jgi:hypothetical protein
MKQAYSKILKGQSFNFALSRQHKLQNMLVSKVGSINAGLLPIILIRWMHWLEMHARKQKFFHNEDRLAYEAQREERFSRAAFDYRGW